MRTVVSHLVIVLVLATAARTSGAQRTPTAGRIDAAMRAEIRATGTPGAAVAVVSGDSVVFLRAYGVTSVETGVPVTPSTLFRSGGLSRLLIAASLLSLADEGKVDLDAPIGRYVEGLSPKLARPTAHQLLASTAGLTEEHLELGVGGDGALRELVRSWHDDRVFAEPGRIYSGSHLSYALAGVLLEAVAGKPFADVVRERVYAPLGMHRSTYRPLVAVSYPFSQGHERGPGGGMEVFRPFGGGSVGLPRGSFESAAESARFLIALLNNGRLDGRQVLSPRVVATLLASHAPDPGADGEEEGYGVHVSRWGGDRVLSVNTSWGGVATTVRLVPARRFAVISLANGYESLTETTDAAMHTFLPPPGPSVASPAPAPLPPDEVARYAGTFANERVLRLSVRDGRLIVRDVSPRADVGSDTDGGEWPVARLTPRTLIATQPSGSRTLRLGVIEGADGRLEFLYYGGRVLVRR